MRFSAHGLISSLNFFSKIHFLILSLPILLLHIIIITVADCVCCEGGHIQTHIVHRRKKWHFPGENEKTLIIFEGRKKKTRCQDVHLSTSARMCGVCMSISSSRLFQKRKEESPSTRHAIYIRIVKLKCHSIFYQ